MSEVKRWNMFPYDQYSVDERTSPNGEWVKWEDYEALAAERERLAEESARLRDALTSVLSWHDKDKHASGKMTFERSAAFAKARAALAAFKGDDND